MWKIACVVDGVNRPVDNEACLVDGVDGNVVQ